MRKNVIILGLLALGLAAGCLEKPGGKPVLPAGALVRAHFAGTDALASSTNAAKIQQGLALPATAEVREETLRKLAKAPLLLWRKEVPPGAADQAASFMPLLADWLAAESYLEIRGPGDRAEYALAVQLDDERAKRWNASLREIISGWKLGAPEPITVENAQGWQLKKRQSPNLFQYVRAGRWVIVGLGQDRLTALPALVKQAGPSGRPVAALDKSLLEIEADWPQLGGLFPKFADYRLPPCQLTLTGEGENLRTTARLRYGENIPWKFEPWRIPTNIISEPIVSFTAGQGIAPLLSQVKGVPELGMKELPTQFCSWGLEQIHYLSYATVPLANPSNVVRQIAPKLPLLAERQMGKAIGNFLYVSNRAEIIWRGMPFIAPFLKPLRAGGTDYLFLGMYPPTPLTNSPPPELFAQVLGRKDLAYYDWEITQTRLHHARQTYQLLDLIHQRQLLPADAPTYKWLQAVEPLLGETVTEVAASSPKELVLRRKSHLGLTGFELATLTRWLDSPGFPLSFEPPAPLVLRTNLPAHTASRLICAKIAAISRTATFENCAARSKPRSISKWPTRRRSSLSHWKSSRPSSASSPNA